MSSHVQSIVDVRIKPSFRSDELMDGEIELLLSILPELLMELGIEELQKAA